MTLYFEEEGDVKLPLECEALAKRVVEEALDYVGCPYEAEVNLLLTENAQIHEMNKEFRGIDRATDVLSFPMIDYPEPGTFDFLEEQEDCFDPESGELTLGDIVRKFLHRQKSTDTVRCENMLFLLRILCYT